MRTSQRGFVHPVIALLIGLSLLSLIVYLLIRLKDTTISDSINNSQIVQDTQLEYAPLTEDEATPDEINNDSIAELDSMMMELDVIEDISIDDLDL